MVKRKLSASTSDLRTNSIGMSVQKYPDIASIRSSSKKHWGIDHIQPFFPPIEKLFKTENIENIKDYGIRFENGITDIRSATTIRTSDGSVVEVHKKITMLLGPYKWMQGDYGTSIGLPTSEEESDSIRKKVQNSNNAAYVGSLLSVALSQSGCQHFPKTYGVFSGMSDKHVIDISDDYGDLCERSWFSTNIGKTFEIKLSDDVQDSADFKHTRSARISLQLGDDINLEGVTELDSIQVPETQAGEMNRVFQENDADSDDESDSSSVSTSYIYKVKSCECDSEDSDNEDEDDDEECEPFAWASFTNVPVQITVIEKCTGTLYELFKANPESHKHLAWLSQVVFALAFAQRTFAFTHNDLHSNNVMYVPTTSEYFYYNCAGLLYRVPTYGYLIKIIDFERGIGMVKLSGLKEPKLFMSDHFSIDEEAGGQYNYEPWYNSKFQEVKPNPSFDLVRLATSLFWDLFPEGPDNLEYASNPVFRIFIKWLTLEDGSSIMFKVGDAKHDRYHGFHLYKAISRFCKDAVPRKEIALLKGYYGVDSVPEGVSVLCVDC